MIGERYLNAILPGWMLDLDHWKKIGRGAINVIEQYMQDVVTGRLASMPGQTKDEDPGYPNTDALKLIGRDRRLPKGVLETDVQYAERLRRWRDSHTYAGTYRGMINALGAVLVPGPVQIHIVRSGYQIAPLASTCDWWTLNADGLRYLTKRADGSTPGVLWPANGTGAIPRVDEPQDWNWDSASWEGLPLVNPDESRVWIIISACNPPQLDSIEGHFDDHTRYGDADLTGDKLTIGTTATESYVQLIRSVLKSWKAPGCRVEMICVEFTEGLFEPVDGFAMPDGHWKYHSKTVDIAGVLTKVRARDDRARYFSGTEPLLDAGD